MEARQTTCAAGEEGASPRPIVSAILHEYSQDEQWYLSEKGAVAGPFDRLETEETIGVLIRERSDAELDEVEQSGALRVQVSNGSSVWVDVGLSSDFALAVAEMLSADQRRRRELEAARAGRAARTFMGVAACAFVGMLLFGALGAMAVAEVSTQPATSAILSR